MSVGGAPTAGEFDLSNPLKRFVDVVRRIVLHPVRFYAELPRRGSLLNPLLFALICSEIATIMGGVLSLLGVGGTQDFQSFFLNPAGGYTDVLGFVVDLLVLPIIIGIILFVYAGILHLMVRWIVGAGNLGFEATFRIPSYSNVAYLVFWIPIIGPLLSLYAFYLEIVGVKEMYETTTDRAVAVVLAALGLFILLILVLAIVAYIVGFIMGFMLGFSASDFQMM